MKFIFLFIDGLGIGVKDPDLNPCCFDETEIFRNFTTDSSAEKPFNGLAFGLDATMGLGGLPQSATGQTALLTGFNSAKLVGSHLSGFPNETLRRLLLEHSLLLQLKNLNLSPAFLNAFRPLFFELEDHVKMRLSATTVANLAAGLPFHTLEDVIEGRSIYQDFTNFDLLEKGFEMPVYTPEEAAEIAAGALDRFDFILYEYFKTDKAGHKQDMSVAREEIEKLGRFVYHLLSLLDLGETTVLLTSDHGNIEDLSTRSHTRNPAMTILWGKDRKAHRGQLNAITDVTPIVLRFFEHRR